MIWNSYVSASTDRTFTVDGQNGTDCSCNRWRTLSNCNIQLSRKYVIFNHMQVKNIKLDEVNAIA